MAPPVEHFSSLGRSGAAEHREKGSVFLATAEAVTSEQAVRARISGLIALHRDASHVCWASRLGWPPLERCFDAGEPRGTAGPPILRVLQGATLSDALIAVVRWFGGTKLGKGGLARAYAEAAKLALAQASRVDRVPVVRLRLELPYQRLGAVQRLVAPPSVQLVSCTYGATVSVELLVANDRVAATLATLADLGLVAVSVGASTANARR